MKEILLNNGAREIHLPAVFSDETSARLELSRAREILEKLGAQTVSLEVCAGSYADGAVSDFCAGAGFPVNRILPLSAASPVLGGAHITAVAGARVKFARTPRGDAAAMYSDGSFEYCRTFGIVSDVDRSKPFEHTMDNLVRIEDALGLFGFSYNDIARTWFYNDDILAWYPEFNRARTSFYGERKIFDSLLPASTGIGAPNPHGALITSGAIALRKIGEGEVFEVESPLQCGAPKYGSSFSRAVEIDTPASRRVMVSGTASIEPGGATAFVGDIEKQVALTMRVISAILESRKMSLSDTVRAIVYCLRPEFYGEFLRQFGGANIAHIPSHSTVCRSDLLFEVELEAAAAK